MAAMFRTYKANNQVEWSEDSSHTSGYEPSFAVCNNNRMVVVLVAGYFRRELKFMLGTAN